jgi:hypothetical protein
MKQVSFLSTSAIAFSTILLVMNADLAVNHEEVHLRNFDNIDILVRRAVKVLKLFFEVYFSHRHLLSKAKPDKLKPQKLVSCNDATHHAPHTISLMI